MQSVAVYGRLLARAIVAGINNEFQPWASNSTHAHASSTNIKELHLVTALSGISKSLSSTQILKKWTFGDDACFLAKHKLAEVIGVADGVGGWRQYGIDPSLFPKSLMSTCERLVKEGRFQPQLPAGLISASYFELLENKEPLVGSCTACVIALDSKKQRLYTANLGDSGFRVIREGKVVHRSEEQQHYFNAPFQLAIGPPTMEGLMLADSPESAQTTSFDMQTGDLILVGTDGLFDNMTDNMLLDHLSKVKFQDYSQDSLQRAAHRLAQEAHKLAFDEDYMSPFADSAVAHGYNVKGGKPDDITVVLSKVALGEAGT